MEERKVFDFPIAETSFAEILRSRRTVNDFRADLPPDLAVLQAIELARWAPNHKMTEPWRFHLLGQETTTQLIEIQRGVLTAEKGAEFAEKKLARWATIPGWLIVTAQSSADPLRDRENYAAVCCAIQNLMLALWSEDIGTKWATGNFLQLPSVADLLNLDSSSERIVGLIWYGYPASVPESRRCPVSDITIVHP